MSKKCLLTFLWFCFFSALSFTVMHLFLLLSVNQWVGVGCGIGIFVCSLVVMLLLRKKLKKRKYFALIFVPFNAVACGLAVSSLFVYLGESPLLWQSAAVWGALAAAFALFCFFTNLRFFRNYYLFCMIVYAVMLLAGAIVGICLSSTAVFSLALITLITFYGFFMTLAVKASTCAEHIIHVVDATYSLVLVVIVVVMIVLSEGDAAADGLDLSTGGRAKLRQNPYDFEP